VSTILTSYTHKSGIRIADNARFNVGNRAARTGSFSAIARNDLSANEVMEFSTNGVFAGLRANINPDGNASDVRSLVEVGSGVNVNAGGSILLGTMANAQLQHFIKASVNGAASIAPNLMTRSNLNTVNAISVGKNSRFDSASGNVDVTAGKIGGDVSEVRAYASGELYMNVAAPIGWRIDSYAKSWQTNAIVYEGDRNNVRFNIEKGKLIDFVRALSKWNFMPSYDYNRYESGGYTGILRFTPGSEYVNYDPLHVINTPSHFVFDPNDPLNIDLTNELYRRRYEVLMPYGRFIVPAPDDDEKEKNEDETENNVTTDITFAF
jgi:hypothetical protein